MKCNKCQSEWNGVKELDACPFCGANLKPEIKDKDFQSVGEFLSYVISAFGLDVLRDSRKLVSLFADLAPTLEQERNLLRIATESGVYKDILSANDESESEKQNCITRCKITLESKYFMQSEWSEKAILWLTDYLGWNVKVQTAPPPAPKPVQPAQPVVVQPTQKPAAPPVQQTKAPVASQQTTAAPRQTTTTPRPAQPVVQAPSAPSTPKQTPPVQQVQTPIVPQQKTTPPPKPVQPTAQTTSVPSIAPQGVAAVPSVHNARMLQKRLAIGGRFYNFFDDKPNAHVVGILKDGTVAATGHNENGKCGVADWKDVVKVAACETLTLGLKKDGTVLWAGSEYYCKDASSWTDIVDIAVFSIDSNSEIAGVKKDGTVVSSATYKFKNISNWQNIVAVSFNHDYFLGLKKDGTVVIDAWSPSFENRHKRIVRAISQWKDIVAISTEELNIIALKKDGTVVTAGFVSESEDWVDIVSISSCGYNTVLLKKDGTVVYEGNEKDIERKVSKWQDIVAVKAGKDAVIGLKSDGTLVSTYKKLIGNKFKFENWKLF